MMSTPTTNSSLTEENNLLPPESQFENSLLTMENNEPSLTEENNNIPPTSESKFEKSSMSTPTTNSSLTKANDLPPTEPQIPTDYEEKINK